MHPENCSTTAPVRPIYRDLPIEPPCPQQRRVENFGPVSSREQDHAHPWVKAVKFREELVQGLLFFIVTAKRTGSSAATKCIEFVDEDDAGCRLARLLEEVANARRADPDEHFHEFRAGDGKERDPGLTGYGAGEQGLAGTRRADQQDTLGNMSAESTIALRILEKGYDFLQLEFCFVDAGHVSKSDLGVLFDIDLGT